MEKIWAAVSQQGVILKQLLLEHSAPPALPAPLGPHGAASADWPQEDILSFNISEEAGKQELMFSSEDVEPDTTSPAVKLSLSSELMLLLRRATSTLQFTWISSMRSNPPGAIRQHLLLFHVQWTPYTGRMTVEASIVALVQVPNLALLSKDAACPNKQCQVSEVILKKAYSQGHKVRELQQYPGDVSGTCGDPGIPAHGNREDSGFKIRSKVHFTCDTGYILYGSTERMCFPNGTWSGRQPACHAVQCGNPGTPANGRVFRIDGTTFSHSVSYSCMEGYLLSGSSVRQCTANGTWSGSLPNCTKPTRTTCENPGVPRHGYQNKTLGFQVGSVVQFHCERGYLLQGSTTRVCLKDLTWSGVQTECIRKTTPKTEYTGCSVHENNNGQAAFENPMYDTSAKSVEGKAVRFDPNLNTVCTMV
ncbi:UNVERIFIED_CONTAM: hypothetical protein FKN15_059453 [Acipenser sinensis]